MKLVLAVLERVLVLQHIGLCVRDCCTLRELSDPLLIQRLIAAMAVSVNGRTVSAVAALEVRSSRWYR